MISNSFPAQSTVSILHPTPYVVNKDCELIHLELVTVCQSNPVAKFSMGTWWYAVSLAIKAITRCGIPNDHLPELPQDQLL